MPGCAAFVDDLRAAFGAEEINSVIKRGLRPEAKPEHRVYFAEAGHELGHPSPIQALAFSPLSAGHSAVPSRKKGSRS